MDISIEQKRFKQIREELKFTQVNFGKVLGMKTSTADIEYGKTRITGEVVMKLLQEYHINPLWLFGQSKKKYLNPFVAEVSPKAITVNEEGQENIILINAKAAAGYGHNIGDLDFIQKLPTFNFPLPEYRNSSFRGFQITGDSMHPLVKPGDWVLAKAVSSFDDVKNGKVYVVVEPDSIRLKEIRKRNNGREIELISWNPEYPIVKISMESVLEIWEFHSKISFGVEKIQGLTLDKVYRKILEIEDNISISGN